MSQPGSESKSQSALNSVQPGLNPELGLSKEEPTPQVQRVDVVIAIDATASMGDELQAAANKVTDVFNLLQEQHPEKKFRLGLVAYRDFGDKEQFVIQDLTLDIYSVQEQIAQLKALGGADTAEDVAGALLKLNGLSWEADICQVLFVTDAPAHGLAYHAPNLSDDHPDGDRDGINPEEQIALLASKNIGFTFFRMNSSTDIMSAKFQVAYQTRRVPGSKANFILADVEEQLNQAKEALRASSFRAYGSSLFRMEHDEDYTAHLDVSRAHVDVNRGGASFSLCAGGLEASPSDAAFSEQLLAAVSSQL